MNVKVIPIYFGNRRSSPKTPQESLKLLNFLLEKEFSVDPGCQMDTVLVYNQSNFTEGEDVLNKINGQSTRRGLIKLLSRENIGMSYGAYSYAYDKLEKEYKYWCFTEDDRIIVRKNYFSDSVDKLIGNIGFVGMHPVYNPNNESIYCHPAHCCGGSGVTTRNVLRIVKAIYGKLPYYNNENNSCDYKLWNTYGGNEYQYQEILGEIRFTHTIYRLGYQLTDLNCICCVYWNEL